MLFIDEIHRLNRSVEEVLYPAMEDFALDIIIGKGPAARSIRLPLPKFTLIGATTRAGQLTARAAGPVWRDAPAGAVHPRGAGADRHPQRRHSGASHCTPDGALEIASRCRGTPRIANRMLKRVRDFAQVMGDGVIT